MIGMAGLEERRGRANTEREKRDGMELVVYRRNIGLITIFGMRYSLRIFMLSLFSKALGFRYRRDRTRFTFSIFCINSTIGS